VKYLLQHRVMFGMLIAVMAMSILSCGTAKSGKTAESSPVYQLSEEESLKYNSYFMEAMV